MSSSMLVKAELRLLPIAVQAAMQTTAIKAAINPYSIAVTPELVLEKIVKKRSHRSLREGGGWCRLRSEFLIRS